MRKDVYMSTRKVERLLTKALRRDVRPYFYPGVQGELLVGRIAAGTEYDIAKSFGISLREASLLRERALTRFRRRAPQKMRPMVSLGVLE